MARALNGTPVEPQNSLCSVAPSPVRQLQGSTWGDPMYQKSIWLPSWVNVSHRDSPIIKVFEDPSVISASRTWLQQKKSPSMSSISSDRFFTEVLVSSESAVEDATPR